MKWIWIYFLCGQEVWSEPSMGARMVPANGQTTKDWLERLSILLQIYTFACNFWSRKGGRASIGYRASIGTYTVAIHIWPFSLHYNMCQPRWLSGLTRSCVHSLWLLVDHCVLSNWDRILVRAVKGLISRASMVSICPLLWQRDVKLQQTNIITCITSDLWWNWRGKSRSLGFQWAIFYNKISKFWP